jgi:hypothetical protein
MTFKKLALFLILFSITVSMYGIESLGVTGGVMYVRNSNEEGAPSPLLPYIGLTSGFLIMEKHLIEPSLTVTGNYYMWSEEQEIALPAEIEYADSVFFITFMLDIPYVWKYEVSEKLNLGALAGANLVFRIPGTAWGEGENQKSDMTSYFLGGRFLFLEAGGFLEWRYAAKKYFRIGADIIYPVYHLWDGGSKTDQLTLKLGVTFNFGFKTLPVVTEEKEEIPDEDFEIIE